jgi:hypothetical protein
VIHAAIGERTDETNRNVRRAGSNDGEIGMLRFTDIGQAIETAAELDYLSLVTQSESVCTPSEIRSRVRSVPPLARNALSAASRSLVFMWVIIALLIYK